MEIYRRGERGRETEWGDAVAMLFVENLALSNVTLDMCTIICKQ